MSVDKIPRLQKYAELVEMPGVPGHTSHTSQIAIGLGRGPHLRANKYSIGEAAGAWPLRPRLHAPDPFEGLHTPQHPLITLSAQTCPTVQQAWLRLTCSRGANSRMAAQMHMHRHMHAEQLPGRDYAMSHA